MDDSENIERESLILQDSVHKLIKANEELIHLVAKLMNQYEHKVPDDKAALQRAYSLTKIGRDGLVDIKFMDYSN